MLPIRYGGANRFFENSMCPLCQKSVDKHRIPSIYPSGYTTELAVKVQGLLDKVDMTSILKGYGLGTKATMVGAAHAKFSDSTVNDYVTVSGGGAVLLALIDQGKLGKITKITIITDLTAIAPKTTTQRGIFLYRIDGQTFLPSLQEEHLEYPLGSCAAQKLLAQIF